MKRSRVDAGVVERLEAVPPRRHDHRVRAVSTDYGRLRHLDHLVVGVDAATGLVESVCAGAGVPVPRLRFHARRSPFTGLTEAPRDRVITLARQTGATVRDASGLPEHGAIRLGRRTTLMTLAHELGHHLVNHLDPVRTAAHGNRWVLRFDQAAAAIEELVGLERPSASSA